MLEVLRIQNISKENNGGGDSTAHTGFSMRPR